MAMAVSGARYFRQGYFSAGQTGLPGQAAPGKVGRDRAEQGGPGVPGLGPSARRHADGTVNADDLAVEHLVFKNVAHQFGVVLWKPQARREGH